MAFQNAKAPTFTRAILRRPSPQMINGITTAGLGLPDFDLALRQHEAYADALAVLGLKVTVLPPDPRYPDGCFVEDIALCTPVCAIVTRPGAESRRGETEGIAEILSDCGYGRRVFSIQAPATLDAGDIMMVGDHYLVGQSDRTNIDGVLQLHEILGANGMITQGVPLDGALHLKTVATYMEHGNLLVAESFAHFHAFQAFNKLVVPDAEAYGANAIYVNGSVVIADGFPTGRCLLEEAGYPVIPLKMSEFQKLDGGLSCLSLRF